MAFNKIFTRENILNLLFELFLLSLSGLIFALSFPSFLNRWGLFPLAFISLIPVFIVVHRIGFIKSIIYGAYFGYFSYSLFNFWLATFDPMAFVVVPIIYASYFLVLFPLLKLADRLFPAKGFILQIFLWLSYEFLRTKGFLGYSYGVLGYTQYNFLSLIGIADITGVAGVTFIVIYPSIIIGNALKEGIAHFKKTWREWLRPSVIWFSLFILFNIYGLVSKVNYDDTPKWRPALIQHNINSWRSGIEVFEEALDKLLEISNEALEEKPDALIWSETAFVPSIDYHLRTRVDRRRVELIHKLFDFMDQTDVPLFLGNNDLFYFGDKRVNYNSVFHYEKGELQGKYYKTHLVPFTEHFPYENIFPGIYQKILDLKVNFYGKGDEYTLFEQDGIKLAPLICFEDTFGYLSREFVLRGGDILMNLTNDSWSDEYACNIQHMGIAVFRTIENRRSMIRSTTGGFTTVIDPNGKRIAELEPFTEGYLISDVPVYNERTTIYTKFGNWLDILSIILSFSGIALGILLKIKGKKH
ncbi:apolipoprotein N-acyltransferase [Spirochaeta isovalerica]|uniref:Apolipoprotein N-acyltransferase n=1 Tax=Spirochaeta isovalerica TaxID=150 RepID=A0A841R129_9SPIO|nr:apolipoprotein N-acyltransferase [Spirochaeta isovalerica]MBB6478664.1 apolipoprotein N-acyltransferase [Spirochaeta isovalerica]